MSGRGVKSRGNRPKVDVIIIATRQLQEGGAKTIYFIKGQNESWANARLGIKIGDTRTFFKLSDSEILKLISILKRMLSEEYSSLF